MIDQIDQLDESTESLEHVPMPEGFIDVNSPVVSPEYEVKEASAKLEIYTLKEAISDDRIADMLAGVLSSTLVGKPAHPYARGLVVFAQPQIDESGDSFIHTAHLMTNVPVLAQDLMVIIARTGAQVDINLEIEGGGKLLRELIILAQEDVKLRVHSIAKDTEAGKVIQNTLVVAGIGSEITLENLGMTNETKRALSGGAVVNE